MKTNDPDIIEKLVIKALVLTVSVITLTIGSCCVHVDYRISKAIDAGADPVLARIAFSNGDGNYERVIHIAKEKR